jgi:hypothetical protein
MTAEREQRERLAQQRATRLGLELVGRGKVQIFCPVCGQKHWLATAAARTHLTRLERALPLGYLDAVRTISAMTDQMEEVARKHPRQLVEVSVELFADTVSDPLRALATKLRGRSAKLREV